MDIHLLSDLFKTFTGNMPQGVDTLKQSGSGRKYFRLKNENTSLIGCLNDNVAENEAFFHLSEVFSHNNLNVPKVLQKDPTGRAYLQTDLGDDVLFDRIVNRQTKELSSDQLAMYKKVLTELIRFQTIDLGEIDSSKYYPVKKFGGQSIEWDLNYFKYYFLNLHDVPYNEFKLQHDFNTLRDFVLNDNGRFFMYRDFQSRNIIIHNNEPHFVDFQGGRKGPLAYDVVSLLYQARARITEKDRETLLQYYLTELKEEISISEKTFLDYYYPIALIRTLQVLGAYGYRGLIQKKSHFLSSIGYALENLQSIIDKLVAFDHLPELKRCLNAVIEKKAQYSTTKTNQFRLVINSFSYLNGGVPVDFSGHGGGYAFDCRMLPNPGRLPEYRASTGMDANVQQFLRKHEQVEQYINDSIAFAAKHIDAYIERDFSYLSINFGCTGGQHRSVYCAEQAAQLLKKRFENITIEVNHLMQNKSYVC